MTDNNRPTQPATYDTHPALHDRHRAVMPEWLALYYDRGMKMVQIAKKLGVNRSTVSRTIKRAQDKLRRYLRYSL